MKPFPKKIVSGPNNGNGKGTVSADTVKNVSNAENKEIKESAKEPQKDEKKTTTDSKPEAKVSEKSGNNGKGKTKAETRLRKLVKLNIEP